MEEVYVRIATTNFVISTFETQILNSFNILRCKGEPFIYTIDLMDVEWIDVSVITHLFSIAEIAKMTGGVVKIYTKWESKLYSYLSDMGFYDINDFHGVIDIDESNYGGRLTKRRYTRGIVDIFDPKEMLMWYEKKYQYPSEMSEKDILKHALALDIRNGLGRQRKVFKGTGSNSKNTDFPTLLKAFFSEGSNHPIESKDVNGNTGIVSDIISDFEELIHNAIWHGADKCFFAMQAYKTQNLSNPQHIIDISLSDVGCSLYESLKCKNWETEYKTTKTIELNEFKQLENHLNQDYYSIIESILFRKNDVKRGLYDLLNSFNVKSSKYSKRGKIRFTNNAVSLELDTDMIDRNIIGNEHELIDEIKKQNRHRMNSNLQPIAWKNINLMPGFHITIHYVIEMGGECNGVHA